MITGRTYSIMNVYLDTTGSCTNKCYMCPGRAAKIHNNPMPDSVFDIVIERLKEYQFKGNLHFYGQNEPFTDSKIFERVYFARESLPEAKLHMISNFTVINEDQMDKLAVLPLDRLVNSIYALDADSYLKICQKPNFNRAISNQVLFVKKWAKKKTYPFNVFLLDTEYNRHDNDFIQYFLEILPVTKTVYTSLFSSRHVLPRKVNMANFGLSLYQNLLVTGGGKVSICNHDHDCDLSPGNIKDMELAEIVNGPQARALRRGMLFAGGGTFCSVCDWANEHKLLFFLLPHDSFRKKILAKYSLDNGFNKKTFRTIAENSADDIDKKMDFFTRTFPDNHDVSQIISTLRKDFLERQY